ncbi:MAG: hypothetical protein C0412_17105, partial [Flavobacterium sp.]|nr:hypothetical protein [Flavobacterium sp.]
MLKQFLFNALIVYVTFQFIGGLIITGQDLRKSRTNERTIKQENLLPSFHRSSEKNWNDFNDKIKNMPGEVIISYEVLGNYSVKGSEITNEYNMVVSMVNRIAGAAINSYRPVSSYIVNQMMTQNKSEFEIKMVANNLLKSALRKTAGAIDFENYNSARKIVVKTELYDDSDLLSLIDMIKSNKQQLSDSGVIIKTVEPNYLAYISMKPNDPMYWRQSNSYNNTGAEEGWNIERGAKEIKVGIIDTGTDTNHPDLKDNIDFSLAYDFVNIDTTGFGAVGLKLISGEDYFIEDSDPKD